MRPALLPLLLLSLACGTLVAQEPQRIEPTLDSLNLQMSRGADGDEGTLQLGLVTQFPERRLLGWKDATVITAESDDGQRLKPAEISDVWASLSRESEDDLAVPLALSLGGLTSPPLRLKRLRIQAIAVLAYGDHLDLALPAKPQGRIFAPADDPRATLRAERQDGNWQLTISTRLNERCLRIQLRHADGSTVPCAVDEVEQNPQHRVVSVQPRGDADDALPVLILAQHLEYRQVLIAADGLALFGTLRNPELLPLGKNPAADGPEASGAVPGNSGPGSSGPGSSGPGSSGPRNSSPTVNAPAAPAAPVAP